MTSTVRRGTIPFLPSGRDTKLIDEIYTQGGFYGPWTQIYRRRNPGHPKSWSGESLMYGAVDAAKLETGDLLDPEGAPTPLLRGDGVIISVSRRSEPMPFAEKDLDYHQIRFYQSGKATLETELGSIDVEAGDFVTIPKCIIYRETPKTDDFVAFVFQVSEPVITAEALWDSVGFVGYHTDYSGAVYPEPKDWSDDEINVDTRVRLFTNDTYQFLEYPFDPCRDVIGWLGDPVIFKLNLWQTPGLATNRAMLPPNTGLVLLSESKSFLFGSLGPKSLPSESGPDASFGPPCHCNDYDEVLVNHVSEMAPESVGLLWFLSRAVPHPGLKGAPQFPPNPPRRLEEMKLTFDCRAKLAWTPEALAELRSDPNVDVYTGLMAAHVNMIPEAAVALADKNFAGHDRVPSRSGGGA